jgi:hypothetical protein
LLFAVAVPGSGIDHHHHHHPSNTFGGMTEDAEELVDQLSLTCKDHLTLPSSRPFANSIRSSIAVAIQRGNALAIQCGFSRAVMRAGRQAGVA